MRYAVGIDIGSTSGEVVLLDGDQIAAYSIVDTGYNSRKAAELALDKALRQVDGSKDNIGPTVATGYGRVSIDFADRQVTEISCYARGTHFLYPNVRTVVDIGGQDSKVVLIGRDGRVLDFAMNDKCAAGTGRFLEVTARALQLNLDELGKQSLRSKKAVVISSMCTVFAESEVISLVADGVAREDIVAGLHQAIARRVGNMIKRVGAVSPVAFAGGVAKNIGVVRALEATLNIDALIVPKEPQIVGALGAALLAQDNDV